MDEIGIAGKVAVVTGAVGGIGAAVAGRLTGAGAAVAVLDLAADRLEPLAEKLAAGGARVRAITVDVRDSGSVESAFAAVDAALGPVEILVNVAGVLHSSPVAELDDADWAQVLGVNLDGVMRCSRAAVRRMSVRRAGTIVTVASNAGVVARANLAAYSASKAAAATFTKCLGLEMASLGIRCNVVSPGSTNTEMLGALLSAGDPISTAITGSPEVFRTGIPLGKVAEPEDIADAVAFLVSRHAGHLTMQELVVDGGATLRL